MELLKCQAKSLTIESNIMFEETKIVPTGNCGSNYYEFRIEKTGKKIMKDSGLSNPKNERIKKLESLSNEYQNERQDSIRQNNLNREPNILKSHMSLFFALMICFAFLFMAVKNIVEYNYAGQITVVQYTNGQLAVKTTPGWVLEMYGRITKYKIRNFIDVEVPAVSKDGVKIKVLCKTAYDLSTETKDIIEMYQKNSPNDLADLIETKISHVTKTTSLYFTAEDMISYQRAKFIHHIGKIDLPYNMETVAFVVRDIEFPQEVHDAINRKKEDAFKAHILSQVR